MLKLTYGWTNRPALRNIWNEKHIKYQLRLGFDRHKAAAAENKYSYAAVPAFTPKQLGPAWTKKQPHHKCML